MRLKYIYMVFHQLVDFGLVDFDLGCFAICPIQLGQMGFQQKQLSTRMMEHLKYKSTKLKSVS